MKASNKLLYILVGVIVAFASIGLMLFNIAGTNAQDGVVFLPFIEGSNEVVQSETVDSSGERLPPPPLDTKSPSIDEAPPLSQADLDRMRAIEEEAHRLRGEQDRVIHAKDIRVIEPNGKKVQLPENVTLVGMTMGVLCGIGTRCPRSPLYNLISGSSEVWVEVKEGVIFFNNYEKEKDESRREQLIARDIQNFDFLIDILGEDKVYVPPLLSSPEE